MMFCVLLDIIKSQKLGFSVHKISKKATVTAIDSHVKMTIYSLVQKSVLVSVIFL